MNNTDRIFTAVMLFIIVVMQHIVGGCLKDKININRLLIEQNHAELMTLITTKYQTEAQFLHSVKTAKLNRINEVREGK